MTHRQIQAAVDRALRVIARQKGSTTTRDFLAMSCLLNELHLVEEPQQPVSATRIALDESAAQKEHSTSAVIPPRVEEAIQVVKNAVVDYGQMVANAANEPATFFDVEDALKDLIAAVRAESALSVGRAKEEQDKDHGAIRLTEGDTSSVSVPTGQLSHDGRE